MRRIVSGISRELECAADYYIHKTEYNSLSDTKRSYTMMIYYIYIKNYLLVSVIIKKILHILV
jgi:hypothetical protein